MGYLINHNRNVTDDVEQSLSRLSSVSAQLSKAAEQLQARTLENEKVQAADNIESSPSFMIQGTEQFEAHQVHEKCFVPIFRVKRLRMFY